MKWDSRNRCALVCFAFTGLFSVFSFRLIYLQMIKHNEYAALAAEKHVYKQTIFAERGAIFDANLEVLAHNVPVETVVADATHLNNAEVIVDLVSSALRVPRAELAEKLQGDRRYIVIKREVPEAVAESLREKLRAENLRGIYFERDATRIYPNGAMLCHVIGFTDFDHHGSRAWKRQRMHICAARTVFAISSTIAPARRSYSTAVRNVYRAMVTRCTLPSI
jgi:cell division protein FtsI/penicillin-binding protein 2